MRGPGSTPGIDDFQLRKALEAFARDLLLLVKSSKIYPNGHPSLNAVATRLSHWTLPDGRAAVSLGVTRTEVVLDGRFFGGRKSRITALAGYLNERKIQRITFVEAVSEAQAMLLGRVLAMRDLESDALARAVKDYGVANVTLEPLDISKIHGKIGHREETVEPSGERAGSGDEVTQRGQQAWLWLQNENARPEEVADALASEALWAGAGEDEEQAYRLTYLLSGLGERLNQGLDLLEPAEKDQVLTRLRKVGAGVSAEQLVQILSDCPDPSILQGQGMIALVGDMEGDKLVDLMAGIVSTEGPQSERLSAVLEQFAPMLDREDVLDTVRRRLSRNGHRGFALEVWKSLETFLLNVGEEGFMGDEYRASLNEVAARRANQSIAYDVEMDFEEDSGSHLDEVIVALALGADQVDGPEWARLFARVRQRIGGEAPGQVVNLLLLIDEMAPYALGADPDLLVEILAAGPRVARDLRGGRTAPLFGFLRRHRMQLLEPALKGLRDKAKIATRRFLVEALIAMGGDSIPLLISRARAGPWYLTRNLAIVLGHIGDPAGLPYLTSLLEHEHYRVRRETLRSLARMGGEGVALVRAYAQDEARDPLERELASAILKRMESSQ